MKKQLRTLSIFLTITLLISTLFGAGAFAAVDGGSGAGIVSENFSALTDMALNSRSTYDVQLDNTALTLAAASSDSSVVKPYLQPDADNAGSYVLVLEAWKAGTATVTLTASDGATLSRDVTVGSTEAEKDYTVSSDTTDFSMPSGNSRYITVHYESTSLDNVFPTLAADNPNAFKVELTDYDPDKNDYYFRVDALGASGQKTTLYMGSSDYVVPDKLCTVTVAPNRDLSIDTNSTYTCNLYDTYRFVVRTSSATPPEVTAVNSRVTIDDANVQKVSGGYEYEMTAQEEGNSLVTATVNGETAAFAVKVNFNDQPSVVFDGPKTLTLPQGNTYTYTISAMGGGTPDLVSDTQGAVTIQAAQKDGIRYTYTVTAAGTPGTTAKLRMVFPNSGQDEFGTDIGSVTIGQPPANAMKSDTNYDFSLYYGKSYLIKLTNVSGFSTGSSGVFSIVKVSQQGADSYYKLTATGNAGGSTGLYMSTPGQATKKICTASIRAVDIKSDTNSDFSLAVGAGYQFKITAPGASAVKFSAGSAGVVNIVPLSHTGDDFYFRIVGAGTPGQQTGIYATVQGQPAKRLCVVTVKGITVSSDTNTDFSLAKGKSYMFKITAAGAGSVSFGAGSAGVVSTAVVSHSGNDFYCKVTAIGSVGQKAGIYVSVPGQTAQKLCVVTVK